ncbi:MAG: class I SAM-dependent methyltransferase, partial [Candidatus Thermoplasmatota archaeon]|nr:class I SAM-dependent methyltransferase [Candidatus Thermoplasmatota archaeon]
MDTFQSIENTIEEKYNQLWTQPKSINRNENHIYQGWHFGFFENGIQTNYDAMLNINTYIARMLQLSEDSSKMILDAGCGVGVTLITLAKKYPHHQYHGISLALQELQLAENIKQKEHLDNIFFKKTSYLNTGFTHNSFDCVYSLESLCYAEDKHRYIKEMKKILKPDGRLL